LDFRFLLQISFIHNFIFYWLLANFNRMTNKILEIFERNALRSTNLQALNVLNEIHRPAREGYRRILFTIQRDMSTRLLMTCHQLSCPLINNDLSFFFYSFKDFVLFQIDCNCSESRKWVAYFIVLVLF